ncbi:hypothetical protein AK812_SmicGene45280 [Symbiodinium microadriaticum]|uniref:Uncharacterized protein n=1 Tax=Symbiodinium microadriaticum TaxID=2951 RepID=A0A1Q9BWC6_SYMMI|nr:hypothetical protein AK812_SmicGene45280 [Symbiodinium microadriaticum]
MQTMTAPTMTILVAEERTRAERHRAPAELSRNMLRFAETVADPATLPLVRTKQARFTNNSSKAAASPTARGQALAKHSRCRHVHAVAKESPVEQVPVLKEKGPGMRSPAKTAVDLHPRSSRPAPTTPAPRKQNIAKARMSRTLQPLMLTMTAPTMTILVAEERTRAERHRAPAELSRNMLRFAETVADPATLPLVRTKQARFTNNSSKAAASPTARGQALAKHSRCRHVHAVAKESPVEQVPVLKEKGPGMRSPAKTAVDLTRHGRELV